jgi:hypothetical protein
VDREAVEQRLALVRVPACADDACHESDDLVRGHDARRGRSRGVRSLLVRSPRLTREDGYWRPVRRIGEPQKSEPEPASRLLVAVQDRHGIITKRRRDHSPRLQCVDIAMSRLAPFRRDTSYQSVLDEAERVRHYDGWCLIALRRYYRQVIASIVLSSRHSPLASIGNALKLRPADGR